MLKFIVGFFFVLHGLVHLLYCGQSQRIFELQAGMVWPDGSWAFSRMLGGQRTRLLATVFLALAAVGFVAGGVGLFAGQAWWRPAVVGAATFSAAIFLLFWDGGWQNLADKGAFALLINATILTAVLVFQWPDFGF
jgi:hypothetical protein